MAIVPKLASGTMRQDDESLGVEGKGHSTPKQPLRIRSWPPARSVAGAAGHLGGLDDIVSSRNPKPSNYNSCAATCVGVEPASEIIEAFTKCQAHLLAYEAYTRPLDSIAVEISESFALTSFILQRMTSLTWIADTAQMLLLQIQW